MRRPGGNPLTRRRRLLAFSRLTETTHHLSIELNSEGTDYQVLPGAAEGRHQAGWKILRLVFEEAAQKLTREDILAEWPPDEEKPKAITLWRWLSRNVELGQIACEGAGRRTDPFRYWLPQCEEVWKHDFLYEPIERQRTS